MLNSLADRLEGGENLKEYFKEMTGSCSNNFRRLWGL